MGKQGSRKNSASMDKQPTGPADALLNQRKDEIIAFAKHTPDMIRPHLETYAPQIGKAAVWIEVVALPLAVVAFQKCGELVAKVEPYWTQANLADIIPAILGFLLCFFGGTFPLLIAAVEAFRLTGYSGVRDGILELYDEAHKAWEAHLKDEMKDDDNDGVPDNQQISANARLQRKSLLILKVTDPAKVNDALQHIVVGWVAVLASLKMQFARAVTLGVSIAEMLDKVVGRKVTPVVEGLVPQDYRKWVPIVMSYIVKAIAMSIAFTVQRVISAFHSALRGGHLFAVGMLKFAHRQGYMNFVPEETYMDETVGYALAFVGFLWQLSTGFALFFPLNLLLLPVTIGEYVLEYVVTFL